MVISLRGEERQVRNASKPVGWVGLGADHKIRKRKADNHKSHAAPVSTSYRSPAAAAPVSTSYGLPAALSTSYGSPGAAAENPVDLHNKAFCLDVSTYQPVVWVERNGEECKTDFVQQCEDKSENVCAEVTETFCEVLLC